METKLDSTQTDITSKDWEAIKHKMKLSSGNNKLFESWLDPIELVSYDSKAHLITFGVPNELHHYYVKENLKDKILLEISNSYGFAVDIHLTITGHKQVSAQKNSTNLEDILYQSETKPMSNQGLNSHVSTQKTNPNSDQLNSEFTFSTFVVGKNSEFAHAASYNVANSPGTDDYNPLLIYGASGMGKTHLLHAAGNHIKDKFPYLRITYISAERFLNECVSALRHSGMDKFRQKYRENSDILLVDDVQYIARGEAVQEEFFHTINTFIEKKKQVILATDRMPKDILGLEDRSRTRLERGLIADITMPDLETRIAILRYKAEKSRVSLTEEVVNYIARVSKRSIRELEGNLKRVKMFSELQGLQIDFNLVKKILANHESQSTISIEEIQKIVGDHYKVKLTDLKSSSRAKPIVVPRQICMYLIKKHMDRSLVDIGKAFGGRDHTTVMNALEKVQNLQLQDQQIMKDIEELEGRIHNITGV